MALHNGWKEKQHTSWDKKQSHKGQSLVCILQVLLIIIPQNISNDIKYESGSESGVTDVYGLEISRSYRKMGPQETSSLKWTSSTQSPEKTGMARFHWKPLKAA